MYFNFANDYFSFFFQNLLDSETFTKFQELLCPKTYWKRTINMIEIIPTKILLQIQQFLTSISDKEEYVITKGEELSYTFISIL